MRAKTFASLLILCGSTAALAAIPHSGELGAAGQNKYGPKNESVSNSAYGNESAAPTTGNNSSAPSF